MEDKGRFEPVTVNKWVKNFSINTPDVHEHMHVHDCADVESQKRYEKIAPKQ